MRYTNYNSIDHNKIKDINEKIKEINEIVNHDLKVIDPIICPSCNNPVGYAKEDEYKPYFYCLPCNIYYEMSFKLIYGKIQVHFTAREAKSVALDGLPIKLAEPEEPQEKPTVPPDGKRVPYHKGTRQKILDIMEEHKRVMETSELVEMTGFQINIVSRTLTKMKKEGVIKKYGHGKYGLS